MEDFDITDYDYASGDPLKADDVAMQVLDKIKSGENLVQMGIMGKTAPGGVSVPQEVMTEAKGKIEGLNNSLLRYSDYKKQRGESMLSFEPEVMARKGAIETEKRALDMLKLHKADDATFQTMLKESGEYEDFQLLESFMPEGVSARERYVNKKSMQMFGFSEREIDSGFAEPQFRQSLGAAELEPTYDAISRWGLKTKNEFDRKHDLGNRASEAVFESFMGMSDSDKKFEEKLNKDFKDITDTERVAIRAMRNRSYAELNAKMGDLRPKVKKLFNTISAEEGTALKFSDADKVGLYKNMDEAIADFANLSDEQLQYVSASLALTAKAHGQDVQGYMAKVGKNFTRSGARVGEGITSSENIRIIGKAKKRFEAKEDLVTFAPLGAPPEEVATRWVWGGSTTKAPQIEGEKDKWGRVVTRPLTKDEIKAVEAEVSRSEKTQVARSAITNWRDSVAKVQNGSWWSPAQWGYTLAGSVPEMALATSGVGNVLLFQSKKGEFQMEFQNANPTLDVEVIDSASSTSSALYTLANRVQLGILTKSKFAKSAIGDLVLKSLAETTVEVGQDLSAPVVQSLYAQFDEQLPDVQLMGEGGAITEAIANAPKTAFAMLPLVALSSGGMKAAGYMDQRQLTKLLKDKKYLASAGLTEVEVNEVVDMPLEKAVGFFFGRAIKMDDKVGIAAEVDDVASQPPAQNETGVGVNYDSTNKEFVVTNNEVSVTAKTAEEAVEAARNLNPEPFLEAEKEKLTPEETDRVIFDRSITPALLADSTDANLSTFGSIATKVTGESMFTMKQRLPPEISEKGDVSNIARARYGMHVFLSGMNRNPVGIQKIADKARDQIAGVAGQFGDIARRINKFERKYLKSLDSNVAESVADNYRTNVYKALRGDQVAMDLLPDKLQPLIKQGREGFDLYADKLVKLGILNKDLNETLAENKGSYVTRLFKAHDPAARWNYATVKENHPGIFEAGRQEIKATLLGKNPDMKNIDEEVDNAMRAMLRPRTSESFYYGTSGAGKANVSNFIQRSDLSPVMLDLLGEVVDPAINVATTGEKVSRLALTYQAQMKTAQWMIDSNQGSRTENQKKGFTERIGTDMIDVESVDKDGNEITIKIEKVKKAYAGLGTIYTTPELKNIIESIYEPKNELSDATQVLLKIATTAGTVSKFFQVVASPNAYATNAIGGMATEILNGRVSTQGWGKRAYVNSWKQADGSYSPTAQVEFHNTSIGAYKGKGGLDQMYKTQFKIEMAQKGLTDVDVFSSDLSETAAGVGDVLKKFTKTAAKGYSAPDNAIKRSAMANEMLKWMEVLPEDTLMSEVMNKAAADVMLTTQNYGKVPKILRQLSQKAFFVPTYVSFHSELIRNTYGTVKLARREIFSDNPKLRVYGMKRVAGMLTLAASSHAVIQGLGALISGISSEDQDDLRVLAPPWAKDTAVFLVADNNDVVYIDISYLIPHMPFYVAAKAALTKTAEGDPAGGFLEGLQKLASPFTDKNIMMKTITEVTTGVKENGQEIYQVTDTDEERAEKAAQHFKDSMFTSGIERQMDKAIAIYKDAPEGFMGSKPETNDLLLGLVGARLQRLDSSSDRFLDDNFKSLYYDIMDIKSSVSKGKQARRTEEERTEEAGKAEQATKDKINDFKKKIIAFKVAKISDERIRASFKRAKVPKEFRSTLNEALTEFEQREK